MGNETLRFNGETYEKSLSTEIPFYALQAKRYGYKVELVEPTTSWKFDVRELAR